MKKREKREREKMKDKCIQKRWDFVKKFLVFKEAGDQDDDGDLLARVRGKDEERETVENERVLNLQQTFPGRKR